MQRSMGRARGAVLVAAMGLHAVAMAPAGAADMASGMRHYNMHCAGCHGTTGRSLNPAAPNLVGSTKTMQSDVALTLRIKTGKNQCPPYLGILKDAEILDVLAYIRTLR